MIGDRQRFTPLQRLLHWLMAVCILAMLLIGVGMLSTVNPKYLTLVSQAARNRDSGARAGPSGGAPTLWRAIAAGRSARADEARGQAVDYAFYVLMIGMR
jgi:hypothetical protein